MRTPLSNLLTAALLATLVNGAAAQDVRPVPGVPGATTMAQSQPASGTHPALPVGHPQTAGGDAPSAFHPQGMQGPKTGALRIVVTPGTQGAAAIGHDAVTVELFSQGTAIHAYKTQIGDGGIVEIHDLPLDQPFLPVVTVMHAGVPQELLGPMMHKYQPAIEVHMPVYEVTAEKPAWTSGIRHVTVEPIVTKGVLALHVTEMMGAYVPGDRAWIGEHNKTLTIQLPPGAMDVQLGQGFAEANHTIANGTITRGKPMLPGSMEYDFGYTLPVTNGSATLWFTTPAPTTLYAIYVPASFHVDQCDGVTAKTAGGQNGLAGRQLLVGKGLKAGQVVTVTLSAIAPPPPPPATVPGDDRTDLHLPHPTAPTKP